MRLPTPPPQIRSPAVVPPGWKARTALHPTLQVDDRATPPSPPCSPLVVVKEEDIDRGVAGFEERSSYYRACQSEPRDDFPEHMYPSSRSASPRTSPSRPMRYSSTGRARRLHARAPPLPRADGMWNSTGTTYSAGRSSTSSRRSAGVAYRTRTSRDVRGRSAVPPSRRVCSTTRRAHQIRCRCC